MQTAVKSTRAMHNLPADHHRMGDQSSFLARIETPFEGSYRSKEDAEAPEKIRAKLKLSYRTIPDTNLIPTDVKETLQDVRIRFDSTLGAEPTGDASSNYTDLC